MKISFISIFPEIYQNFLEHSIIKKAQEKGKVTIEVINPRDFAKNKEVDDYLYGGGAGMLLKVEPIVKALEKIRTPSSFVCLTSAGGKLFSQKKAYKLAKEIDHLIIIAGHYEGVDARIKAFINEEISIGEYILTGGELPSMMIADAIIRLVSGVINSESLQDESFENGLIETDHYTKPKKFRNLSVPEVLLSGNHKEIKIWRKNRSLLKTIDYNSKKRDKTDGKQ